MDDLVQKVKEWGRERGLDDPVMQYAKMSEEKGEIASELTRMNWDSDKMKDSIGDTLVTIIIFSDILGLDPKDCLELAYNEIKDRTGKTVNKSFIKDTKQSSDGKFRILELFGGIGACSKALERLGVDVEIADYVEIDKYAVKSFNAVHGTNFEPQDISKWDKDMQVDLIMHGSPCQDFSSAGKQAGGDKGSGTRSSLMYETLRIVEKLKPKYVIWENVKNLLSKTHRHNFDAYQDQMASLGYENHYQVLNAKDYGVPQNRERVFTVSIREDLNQSFEFPEKIELTKKLKDILENDVDEKYYLSDKQIHGMTVTKFNQYKLERLLKDREDTADTLKARFEGCPQCVEDAQKDNYVVSEREDNR